jgi:hypothetical protein
MNSTFSVNFSTLCNSTSHRSTTGIGWVVIVRPFLETLACGLTTGHFDSGFSYFQIFPAKMSKFKARLGPKMDSARALGIMGFSSTRFMDQVRNSDIKTFFLWRSVRPIPVFLATG